MSCPYMHVNPALKYRLNIGRQKSSLSVGATSCASCIFSMQNLKYSLASRWRPLCLYVAIPPTKPLARWILSSLELAIVWCELPIMRVLPLPVAVRVTCPVWLSRRTGRCVRRVVVTGMQCCGTWTSRSTCTRWKDRRRVVAVLRCPSTHSASRRIDTGSALLLGPPSRYGFAFLSCLACLLHSNPHPSFSIILVEKHAWKMWISASLFQFHIILRQFRNQNSEKIGWKWK